MESHLIDALLARALSFLGVSLYIFPELRKKFFSSSVCDIRFSSTGLALGWISATVLLNVIVLTVGDSSRDFISVWKPEFTTLKQWIRPALFQTQTGNWWLVHALTLTLLTVIQNKSSSLIRAAGFLFWVWTLVRMGHAAVFPLFSIWLWAQFVHNCAIALWIGSLNVLAAEFFASHHLISSKRLRRFSNVMLICMSVILLSGLLRAFPVVFNRDPHPSAFSYYMIFLVKCGLVGFLILVTSQIRRLILSGELEKIENLFLFEFMLAGVLLFVSSLLSQLPPPG